MGRFHFCTARKERNDLFVPGSQRDGENLARFSIRRRNAMMKETRLKLDEVWLLSTRLH